ncbi:MAG: bifunctional 4-hydroxy-2-oxoglutarate aldolase/2-dehydro-3-deoxy-phosphogluconate aldolase [Salinarimonadaceae bacterium]|nr:MAG: bifunctional 4-hydroxy-2-oxoglutarate aldolase/2-dehydro-3-deoxy-phosphogluconate aldolase [Salinarimonadaceae bacterium]
MSELAKILSGHPVIPVVALDDPRDAVGVARALVAGGLPVIEMTLRTPKALACIAAIAEEVPEIALGAGTVMSPRQMSEARAKGAQFLVSPGATGDLIRAATSEAHPWLGGVATISEAMALAEQGFTLMKFFPAEASGGVGFLKSIAPVVPALRFCPTGGINPGNAATYLALDNVFAVGGSWIVPDAALAQRDFDMITTLAREARNLPRARSHD